MHMHTSVPDFYKRTTLDNQLARETTSFDSVVGYNNGVEIDHMHTIITVRTPLYSNLFARW